MLKNTKRTKIVCTLGPASEKEEVLTALPRFEAFISKFIVIIIVKF